MRRTSWTDSVFAVVAIAVSLAVMAPVLLMLLGVFWQGGPSFRHLTAVYGDTGRIGVLLRNTLAVCGVTLAVNLIPGVPLGFLLFRTRLPGRRIFLAAALIASCIPLYAVSTAWMAVIGNAVWFNIGDWWQKALAVGAVQGLAYLPATALICGATFAGGDSTQEDLGLLDAGWRGVFRSVSIPNAAWGLAAAAMAVLVLSFHDITMTDTLNLRTFAEETYIQFQLPEQALGEAIDAVKPWRAAAVALPEVFVFGLLLWLLRRRFRSFGERTEEGALRPPATVPLGRWTVPGIGLVLLVYALVLLIPLGALLRAVASPTNLLNAGRTTTAELLRTVPLAGVAAAVTVKLAFVWAAMARRRYGWLVDLAVVLLLAVPAPLVGVGLIMTLNNDVLGGIYDSPLILVFAWMLRSLPFAALILYPAVQRVPGSLHDAAKLEGAGFVRRLYGISAPLCWRGLACAWLVCLVLNLGELGASFLVCPPGYPIVSVRFFTLIHFGVYADAAGLCLIVILVAMLPAAFLGWLLARVLRRRLA